VSYAEQSALLSDSEWTGRVTACVREQALGFADHGDPAYTNLAKAVIQDPIGSQVYEVAALVTAQPDMSVDATDGDILSAVQALWPTIGATLTEGAAS
jgi:hypothetical protein